jgi:hypothetical protein
MASNADNKTLLYEPTDNHEVKAHPAYVPNVYTRKHTPRRNKAIRLGYKVEAKDAANLKGTPTRASGSKYHDGDFTVLDGSIRLDSKLRTKTKCFSLSHKEYLIGKSANVDGWVITNELNEKVVVLNYDKFVELINHDQHS